MGDSTQVIVIDPDILRKVAGDLTTLGDEVGRVGAEIEAHPVSGRAFGLMNAWLIPPVSGLISHTADLVGTTAQLATAVGSATRAAAADFEEMEREHSQMIASYEPEIDRAAGKTILG